MTRFGLVSLLAFLCIALVAGPIFGVDPSAAAIRGNTEMAVDLYKALIESADTFFFSPYSIYTALALLYAGAEGETADQFAAFLGAGNDATGFHETVSLIQRNLNDRHASGEVVLRVANALWLQNGYPVQPGYLEMAATYQANIRTVDYASDPVVDLVNTWAAENTQNKITEVLLEPLPPDTLLTLANAVYFKGDWLSQFDPEETKEAPFYDIDGALSLVPLMHQESGYEASVYDTHTVLDMPYVGRELSMIVVLPRPDVSLEEVESILTADTLIAWIDGLQDHEVSLSFPKFALRYGFDLRAQLREIGLTAPFSPRVADFRGLDGGEGFFVGGALHKAFVSVDEVGTEAAAVTVTGCFPAGTQVHTPSGTTPIEEVSTGDVVYAYNMATRTWQQATVSGRQSREFAGTMVTIRAGSTVVEATSNHPIFVVQGNGLNDRPVPADIPGSAVENGGRWVEAGALLPGDTILSRSGVVTVRGVQTSQTTTEVHNLTVGDLSNYAVGDGGLLVHNKGEAGPPWIEFRADRPFIFMIRDTGTNGVLFIGRVGRLP